MDRRLPAAYPPQRPDEGTGSNVPPEEAFPSRSEEIGGLEYLVGQVRDHGWGMLVGAVVAGALTFLVITLFVSPMYHATAALAVLPPSVTTELTPRVLSVQGYQGLLESDTIIAQTRAKLIETGDLTEDEPFALGGSVRSRIFVSRREDTQSLSPLIEAEGWAESPTKAAAIANTWSATFLEQVQQLSGAVISDSIDFIELQFAERILELESAEAVAQTRAEELRAERDTIETTWDQRIASTKKKTTDLLAAYEQETRVLLDDLAQASLERASQQGLTGDALRRFGDGLVKLSSVQGALANSNPRIQLEKAISDDALWQSLIIQTVADSDLGNLKNRSLLTEEINPYYADLELELLKAETELRSVLAVLPAGEFQPALDFDQLRRRRAAGLAKLQEERGLQLTIVKRKQRSEQDALRGRSGIELAQLGRRIEQHKTIYRELSRSFNEAILARGQKDLAQVKIALQAVPPSTPTSRQRVLKAILAAILGAMIGLLVSHLRSTAALGRRPIKEHLRSAV